MMISFYILSTFLSIYIAGPVFAQPPWSGFNFGGSSNCGQGCFFQNLRDSGCQFPNIGCVCETETFIPNLTTCVTGSCNATEAAQVLQSASSLCRSATAAISVSTSEPAAVRTSRTATSTTSTVTLRSTFATSILQSTQSDGESISTTSNSRPPASGTVPPSSTDETTLPSGTQSASSTATGGTSTPVGAIVGGVVGGFGGISLILAMVWLIMREKNKGDSIRALPRLMLKPHTDQIDEQPQPIWDGEQVFNWDPRVNSTIELSATETAIQELPTS
ncbi:hypothetical protein TWF481_005243 [Arthrobotrys musiformis]|uniref:CFEM domain-containing protein n=1 Tax=Arthrobotrys musiformis TaxID=47236 RepID=A0AAV9WDA4_9PEZI